MATRNTQRPIIVRRIKKAAPANHTGAWKVAYADFVTAMMAFFMLLWLISNPDKARLKGLAEYFTPSTPSFSPSTTSTSSPGDMPGEGGRTRRAQSDNPNTIGQPTAEAGASGSARGGTARIPDASMRIIAQELRVTLDTSAQDRAAAAQVKIEPDRDGMRISLMDSDRRPMFQGNTAQLNDYARAMLAMIAHKIARAGGQIAIEGHTDGRGGQEIANWRLSGERALSAREALKASGITSDRFAELVAMAGTQPVYPDQPERAENRRITIILKGEAPSTPSDASFSF